MNRISMNQAAETVKLDVTALRALLECCGVAVPQEWQREADLWQQEEAAKRSQGKLAWLAERYTMMIDTCSLLHSQFPAFVEHMTPLLRQQGKALIVPSGVVEELKSLLERKPELRETVLQVAETLRKLQEEGLVRIYGGSAEHFGDQQLLSAATHFFTTCELLVITQDSALSADLMHLNQLGSVRGKKLGVSRINRYGYLSRYIPQEERFTGSRSHSQPWAPTYAAAPQTTCTAPVTSQTVFTAPAAPRVAPTAPVDRHVIPAAPLVAGGDEVLPVQWVPGTGDEVHGMAETLRLGGALGSGGEGTIYNLGDGTVAKIYHAGKLTAARRDKLALMASYPAPCAGVCWPQELLYNQLGELVGYRMERASGKELQRCVLNRTVLERSFPGGKKEDMVRLAITILEKICALHRAGVLLGDINLSNILVASPEKVWFVDCDSYQVGGYPCPVGKSYFIPPELQGKNFSTFLRTPGNEAFAVATLLFMIMLPGKSPYAQQGGGTIEESIRAMEFPYPCGENRSDRTPEGSWRYQWSHLPYFLKEYFYGTFQRGGAYSTEETRLSDEAWLSAFQRYQELLSSGKLQSRDPQSGEIFPTRGKCLNADDQTVSERRTCVECGEEFDILMYERRHFEEKGMEQPRRCPTCRERRKLQRQGLAQ